MFISFYLDFRQKALKANERRAAILSHPMRFSFVILFVEGTRLKKKFLVPDN